MEFTRRPIPSDLAINLNGTPLRKVEEQHHLGLILLSDLRWTEHTNRVLSKAARLLHTLRRLRNSLPRQALLLYYCLYIRPLIEYASVAWPKLPAHVRDDLERFQRRALKIIIRKPIFQHCDHNDLLLTLNQASLQSHRHYQLALVGFHLANQTAPQHLQEVCYPRTSTDHSLRHHNSFSCPKPIPPSSSLRRCILHHIFLTSCQSTFNHPHDYLNFKRRHNNTFSHHPAPAQCTPSHPCNLLSSHAMHYRKRGSASYCA